MENIVVIGGGLMGFSTAWQLSSYGEKVLLLEQQDRKYQNGSSFGESRITRSLGPKKDVFSYLQRQTIKESKKLLRFLNGIDTLKAHKMGDLYNTSPVTYLYNKNQEEKIKKLLFKKQKDKYKVATGDNAFRKFGISIPESYVLIREYKKHSGTLNVKELIAKLRLGIKKHNNSIRYNQKAINIVRKTNYYEIKVQNTQTGKIKIIKTKKIIVAAGAYTVPILKKIAPYFQKLIQPKKVVLSFFKINKKRYKSLTPQEKKKLLKAHPVFDQNGPMFFSMIDKIDKDGLPIFKVGGHQLRNNIPDLNRVWNEKPRNKEKKWAKKHFRKYLKMLEIRIKKKDIQYYKGYSCVYSMSDRKMPYVTNLFTKEGKTDKGIVVIGGMSGVGAKACLTYGLIAADLLLNRSDPDPMYQKTKKKLSHLMPKRKKRLRKFI